MELPSKVEAEMTDATWFAKQQLMKPVQLAQVDWSTSQARNTDIYAVNFPKVMENIESIFLRTLRMYAYYKVSPCFRVQINATQFHQGQLVCSFDPFTLSTRDTTNVGQPLFDHIYATGLPNVKIMASESDAVELCVPFVHPRSFLTTNTADTYNNMGAFRVTILNPLIVAEGTSSTVSVTIWMYAKDAEVHVPIYDHTPILDFFPVEPTSALLDQFSGFTSQLSKMASPILSKVGKGASQAHTMIGNLVSGNVGQALRTGQGLVDTLGELFGFDYPARTIQPPKTISPVENLAVGIGQSQSQRMAIDPFSLHLPDDTTIGESLEAMNLMKIAQMPMLLSQFEFSGTAARDTLLFSCPITPTVSAFTSSNRRTYLSFVSNAFAYWSGGINFDIEAVATRFHSGKLIFAFVPNTSEIPTYAEAATSLPNVIIDLQQSSSTRFKVPYVSSTPVKNVQRLNSTLNPDLPLSDDGEFVDTSIGTLVCYVQNTLTYASNVSPSVELNLYISAADDFSLYVPVKPVFNLVGTAPTVEATSNQIGIALNKNNNVSTATVLSKGQDSMVPRKLFGEQYGLIDLLRRFTYFKLISYTQEEDNIIQNVTPSYFPEYEDNQSPSYLAYFSQIYSAFVGSIRYKFISRTTREDNVQMTIAHIPSLPSNMSIPNDNVVFENQGFATLFTSAYQDTAIEAEVPYYSKYNMLLLASVFQGADIDLTTNGSLTLGAEYPDGFNMNLDIYIAAGEDFRYIYVRPPPFDPTNVGFKVSTLS